jgi:hypothetical protein
MSFRGRKNIYLCQKCGHGFVSIDVDEGVTPFMTSCLRDGCDGWAESCMYPPAQVTMHIPPALEWYKPASLKEVKPGVREHVKNGGLISRQTAAGK